MIHPTNHFSPSLLPYPTAPVALEYSQNSSLSIPGINSCELDKTQ